MHKFARAVAATWHLLDKDVLVGAIDVATNTIETADEVASVFHAKMVHVAPERLVACTYCGIAPLLRKVAEHRLKALGPARPCPGKNWRARSGLPAPIPSWR